MLADLIEKHAAVAANAGDWAAVAQALNAATLVVWDSTPVTYARLSHDLGDAVRQMVAATLRTIASSAHPLAGEVADAHTVLLNEQVGLRIDNDTRQATIDTLAAAGTWPDAVRDAIKLRGKRLASIAGSSVTADECREAWEAAELIAAKLQRISQLNETQAAVASLVQSSQTALSAASVRQSLIEKFDLIAGE